MENVDSGMGMWLRRIEARSLAVAKHSTPALSLDMHQFRLPVKSSFLSSLTITSFHRSLILLSMPAGDEGRAGRNAGCRCPPSESLMNATYAERDITTACCM